MAPPVRGPTFRLDLQWVVSKTDGSREIRWVQFPDVYSGRTVECALAAVTEAACEEVRRISKRPQYDLLMLMGADYHLVNCKFTRVDVEEDNDETQPTR